MEASTAGRVRRQVLRLCHEGLDAPGLAEAFTAALRRVVPFQSWCWHTMDTATVMLTGAIKPDFEPEPRFARYEYSVPDVNKFAFLARRRRSAGILSEATHGLLDSSPRYRDLLRPRGIGHELRSSFVADSGCWAACALYRSPREPDFATSDALFLASLSATVAEGFRRALLVAAVAGDDSDDDGPWLVLLDDADGIESISAAAERWLAGLADVGPGTRGHLPAPVHAVAARARAAAEGDADGLARVRAMTVTGRWVTLHGTRLKGRSSALTAVIVEPAQRAEIAPLIAQAYGLTARECEVTELVLQGLATRQISQQLHLSPLTVQDHLKAIFDKTGVRSRRALVSQVFSDHYAPRVARGDQPLPSGYFARPADA
jgi:DNA-binding CsgD family transcriptional regulator